jgi:hypothetical protein
MTITKRFCALLQGKSTIIFPPAEQHVTASLSRHAVVIGQTLRNGQKAEFLPKSGFVSPR